ncbi:MAG: GNAT family N-acetyltransferase [Blastocatellia bacterium]|nr:GNAT family N-acetyltransferase [Blastocatellia bacterium]
MQNNSQTTRPARVQDAEQLASLFQRAYGESSHPCQDAEYLRRFIADQRNIYLVEVCEDGVVAGMGVTYHQWHDACEWSHGVTYPEHRRTGIAERLTRQAHAACCARQQGDLFLGLPRGQRTFKIGTEVVNPRMVMTGHDGGMNVANGTREIHVTLVARLPQVRFTHITPDVDEITNSAAVQETVWQPLRLRANPGAYPNVSFVGPTANTLKQEQGFSFSFDSACPSRALEIRGFSDKPNNPQQICRALDGLLAAYPTAEHISANVLADKVQLIRGMREMGFELPAYLPAWYKVNNARYDCVKLVKRRCAEEPDANGFAPMIASLKEAFANLYVHQSAREVNV